MGFLVKIDKRVLISLAGVAIVGAAIGGVVAARGGDTPPLPTGDSLLADVNQRIAGDPGKSAVIGQLTRVGKGVFAASKGDRVDVDLLAGKGGFRCMSVWGDGYSSSVSCFELKDIATKGSYQAVIPLDSRAPVLVVGYAPDGTSRAQVSAAESEAQAVLRGQVFVATLDPGALGVSNKPVRVTYFP
jgi:hypothetical protein